MSVLSTSIALPWSSRIFLTIARPSPAWSPFSLRVSVDLVEPVEDARQLFPRDTATRVAHGDDHVEGTGLQKDAHRSSRRRVTDSVVQEVFQDPSDQCDVGEDKGDLRPCVRRDPDALFPCGELELLDHVLDEFPDAEGLGMDSSYSGPPVSPDRIDRPPGFPSACNG